MRYVAAVVFAVAAAPALAQDASGVLKRASTAMGADQLTTLRYAGSGTGGQFGQAYRPDKPWPKVNYSSYERQIDYGAGAMTESMVRSRAEPTGGGALPL